MSAQVQPKYWELMKQLGQATGVDEQDIQAVLGSFPSRSPAALSKQQTRFELHVEKHFPIDVTANSRIIEMAGPSNRNKTTTLVYTATLLGIDWEKVSTFIDSKNVLQAAANVRKAIEGGQNSSLKLSNDFYELTVKTASGQIMAWLEEKATGAYMFDLDGTPFTLRHDTDWARYRTSVRQACDVQMVGKGRNFVVQVGLEEGHALSEYASGLFKRTSQLRQDLQRQAQDSPTVSEEDLVRMIERENNAITLLGTQLNLAREKRATNISKAQDLEALANLLGEILAGEGTERYLNLSSAMETLQDYEHQVASLVSKVTDLQRDITEFEQSLSEGQHTLAIVDSACSLLSREVSRLAETSPSIADLLSSIGNAARRQDLTQISSLAEPVLSLTPDSGDVFPTILKRDRWSDTSEGTALLPLQVSGTTITSVSDLKRFFDAQATRVADALLLRPLLESFYSSISAATAKTTEALVELRSQCDALKIGQATRHSNLSDLQAQLGTVRQSIESTSRPFGSPSGLADALRSAKDNLSLDIARKMDAAESMAAQVGFPLLWGKRDVSLELQEELVKAKQTANQGADEVQQMTASIRDARRRMSTYQEMLRNPSTLIRERNRRIATLGPWQQIMRDIANYFRARRLAFESAKDAERAEQEQLATEARAGLGSNFTLVMDTLNQLIKERSPFCYVNRNEPVQLRVKSYDFLSERVLVEDDDQAVDESTSGGGETSMTVRGLASRITGAPLGNVLLVDEFGDAPTFKDMVFDDLKQLDELGMAFFVDVVNSQEVQIFERG